MNNKDLSYLLINEKDKKNIDFKCLVCKSLLIPKNTIQLECSHIFCHSCILENININQVNAHYVLNTLIIIIKFL